MPRVSRAEMERNRAVIDQAAAKLIREQGLSLSVADVMSGAGLTTGGFYGHFESKDALLAHACDVAFADTEKRWLQRVESAGSKREALEAIASFYLSDNNLRRPGGGCPLPSLAADVAREEADKPVRRAFSDGFEKLLSILEQIDGSREQARRHDRALVRLSMMVGAMALARAIEDPVESKRLLQTAHAAVVDC